MTEIENWLPVVGFEERYQVSDLGRIRNATGKILRPFKDRYYQITLCDYAGRHRRFMHELVLSAFVGPRPPGFQAAHGVAGRLVNRLDNLDWKSVADNALDQRIHGTLQLGEVHHASKITDDDVRAIRTMNGPQRAIAASFGISQSNISLIKLGKAWKHVA